MTRRLDPYGRLEDFWEWDATQLDWATEVGWTRTRCLNAFPCELDEQIAVHTRQVERQRERDAWVVHHIAATFCGSKNAPSINELLGRVVKM